MPDKIQLGENFNEQWYGWHCTHFCGTRMATGISSTSIGTTMARGIGTTIGLTTIGIVTTCLRFSQLSSFLLYFCKGVLSL